MSGGSLSSHVFLVFRIPGKVNPPDHCFLGGRLEDLQNPTIRPWRAPLRAAVRPKLLHPVGVIDEWAPLSIAIFTGRSITLAAFRRFPLSCRSVLGHFAFVVDSRSEASPAGFNSSGCGLYQPSTASYSNLVLCTCPVAYDPRPTDSDLELSLRDRPAIWRGGSHIPVSVCRRTRR